MTIREMEFGKRYRRVTKDLSNGQIGRLVSMPRDQPGYDCGFWEEHRTKWIGTPDNDESEEYEIVP